MSAHSVLAHRLHLGPDEGQAAAELLESEQPIRLAPTPTADELPPGFEDVLQVQVVGYRERLIAFHGHQVPVLDPVWTLIPKER
jgi:hypothetical protein